MTIEDVTVIGVGSITLLCLFLIASIMMNRVDVWAIVRRYVAVRMVLDDDSTSSFSGSSGSEVVGLGQQNHAEPTEPQESEPRLRQLSKEDLIILLAVQRNDEGGYRYSSNQITAFVGGAAAPIKATIAAVRGKKETPPVGAPLKRPANGW